jgi:thiamine-phosphate diphosphorylase/hydroxyethylthiazole kinase
MLIFINNGFCCCRAGATSVRRAAVKTILAAGHVALIKGNEGEIRTVYGQGEQQQQQQEQQRGVDSSSTLSADQKAELVQALAAREACLVLLTGEVDFISDGARTLRIANGHALLGRVTGTGCVLGTTLSAYLAAAKDGSDDKQLLVAAVAGILHFEIAAERAAVRADVFGPGTFVPAFIDELAAVRDETVQGNLSWLQRANVSLVIPRQHQP